MESNYSINPNPKESPVYPYAGTNYYIEILEGTFSGLHFCFGDIQIVNDGSNKKVYFDYNLLYIPEWISLSNDIEEVVGEILQNLIDRGYYESNTE